MIAPPVNLSHTRYDNIIKFDLILFVKLSFIWITINSRIVISIMGFFVLVPGNVVNYMYQVYRSYEEILSLGYSKDDVIVYLAFSALVFSGYSCGQVSVTLK